MDSGFVDVDNGIFPRLRRGKAWTDVDMSMTFHLTKKGSWTLSMDTVHGHLSMDKVSTASLQGMDMDTTDRTMDGQLDTCGHHGHGQPWTDMDGHGRNMTDMDGHNNEPCMACLEGGSSCLKTRLTLLLVLVLRLRL